MTTALVTGAAGFIGSRLTRRLAANGWDVTAVDAFTDYGGVDRKRRAAARLAGEADIEVVPVDLVVDELPTVLDGVDTVFHLAGQPGVRPSWGAGFEDYARNNVVATQRLLDAATDAGVARVVYASSSSIYGNALRHPTDEAATPEPVSPYGVTKLSGELVCGAYAARASLTVVALRYFTVYGPGQRPDMALHRLFEAALGGAVFPRYGDGSQVRDLTFVEDVVAATEAAGRATAPGLTCVNVAGGTQVTLNELIDRVGELVGRPVPVERHPVATGDVERTSGAVGRAAEVLGWSPVVELDDGLREQLAWHREQLDR